MYRLRKYSITAIPLAIVLALSTIIAGMAFPYAASAATLDVGSTVYSRAYSTGGSGNALPDVAHVIDLVISPASMAAASSVTDPELKSWPIIINDAFVAKHGNVFSISGTASAPSFKAAVAGVAQGGLVRVETTEAITIIADGANFTTTSGSGNGVYGPLVIGTAKPDKVEPVIPSKVTLVILDGSTNTFTSNGAGTQQNAPQAGIAVAHGSILTIRSGYSEAQGSSGSAGSLEAQGGSYSAGIGEGPNRQAGKITITGGNITAYSGKVANLHETSDAGKVSLGNGAGIGGGGGNTWAGGSQDGVEIYGDAVVVAQSHGHGAGIGGAAGAGGDDGQVPGVNGGGGAGNSGPISIYGNAKVTATSGSGGTFQGSPNGRGAGIGGGGRSDSTTQGARVAAGKGELINIYGNAEVIAKSMSSGAGIGGAGSKTQNIPGGHCVEVNIYGNARVTAESAGDGAGIGGGGASGGGKASGTTTLGGDGGDGGKITIKDNAIVNAASGTAPNDDPGLRGRGAGIGGGGASGVRLTGTGAGAGTAGSSGVILISGMAIVTGTSSGCGAGIGGGGAEPSGIAGAGNYMHIFGGDELPPGDNPSARLGPTVTTHSVNGTDLGAGRAGDNGTKGPVDDIVITGGSVRAWDSDVVTSGREFSNNTKLTMVQIKNHELGEIVIWPINPNTFPPNASYPEYNAATVGDYNYVATVSNHLAVDGETTEPPTAYLWVPYAYKVLYEPGEAASAVTASNKMPIDFEYLVYNDKATVLDIGNFVYPGHRFIGWKDKATLDPDDPAKGTFYNPADMFYIKGSVTLVAQWADTYKVTYSPGTGSAGATPPADAKEYIEGEKATVLGKGTFAKGSDTFVGWKVQGGDDTVYQEGSFLDIVTDNVTLVAQWATTTYKVTYEANDKTDGAEPDPGVYAHGADVVVVGNVGNPALEKTDSVLLGWTPNGGITVYKPGDKFLNLTSNITLSAVWGHSVTYKGVDIDSGSAPIDANSPYSTNYTVTVLGNTFVKTGYKFVGWTPDGGTTVYEPGVSGKESFSITQNTELTAVWEAEKYTITYNRGDADAGGNPPKDENQYTYGTEVYIAGNEGSPKLVKNGYEFIGWSASSDHKLYIPKSTLKIDGNTILTAVFQKIHTVNFVSNGGTAVSPAKISDGGLIPNVPSPTRAGYTFGKWYTDAELHDEWDQDTFVINKDETLYASWNHVAYHVTYSAGAGSGSVPLDGTGYQYTGDIPATVTVKTDQEPSAPSGKEFLGWYEEDAGYHAKGVAGTFLIRKDTTLVAVYGDTYTITFDAGGGTPGTIADLTVPSGAKAAEPSEPSKFGYIFKGWSYTKDSKDYIWDFGDSVTGNLNLKAKWDAIEYSVKYIGAGATAASVPADDTKYTIDPGTIAIPSVEPTRAGYLFLGWKSSQVADTVLIPADGTGVVTIDGSQLTIFLTAQWKVLENPVMFVSNGGTNVPPDSVETGKLVDRPADPTKTGYSFVDWYKEPALSNVWDFDQDTVPGGGTTLYAKWTVNEYTVAYNKNGGMGDLPAIATDYNFDAQVTVLDNDDSSPLSKTGYTFDGWNTKSDGTGISYVATNIFNMPANDVTLYAKWKINQYTVAYDANGGVGNVPAVPTDYDFDAQVTVLDNDDPSPLSKTGYTFDGWNTKADGTGTGYIAGGTFDMPATGVTLYAKWKVNGYTVTYDENGGTGTLPAGPTAYNFGETVIVLGNIGVPPLSKTGHTFNNWNTAADGSGTPHIAGTASGTFEIPANGVTLYAQWSPILYSVIYDVNGGAGGPVSEAGLYATSSHTLKTTPVPTHADAAGGVKVVFIGWAAADDNTIYEKGDAAPTTITTVAISTADVTVYALWGLDSNGDGTADVTQAFYDVSFDLNGATGAAPTTQSILSGQKAEEPNPEPTRTNYTFGGWYTDSGCTTGNDWDFDTAITTARTLYAKWTELFTLTYDLNDGGDTVNPASRGLGVTDEQVAYGELINSAVHYGDAPTRTGYTFGGWYDETGGTTPIGSMTMPNAAKTIYAKWTLIPAATYSVTYDGNGNTGGTAPQDSAGPHADGASVPVLGKNDLECSGKTFAGWLNSVDGITYQPGQTFVITAETTMMAQWSDILYTVTYLGSGRDGGTPPAEVSYGHNATVVVLSEGDLVKAGNTFAAWIDQNGNVFTAGATFTITENTVFTPQWSSTTGSFTITYVAGQGASGDAPVDASEYLSGSPVIVDAQGTLFRLGYSFAGWLDTSNNTIYNPADPSSNEIIMLGDTILVAQWTPIEYRVDYTNQNADGGTPPMDTSNPYHIYDYVIVLDNNDLEKAGHVFRGWIDGVLNIYPPGSGFNMPADNVKLDPLWKAIRMLNYGNVGAEAGSAPTDPTVYGDGDTVIVKDAGSLVKHGYIFEGWTPDGGITVFLQGSSFVIAADTVLEPVWSAGGSPIYGSGGGTTTPTQTEQTEQTKGSPPTGDFRNIIPSIIALLLSSYITTALVRRRKHE